MSGDLECQLECQLGPKVKTILGGAWGSWSEGRWSGAGSPLCPVGENHLANGLDPVAETAIRQLTEPGGRAAKKTPTKRSTLIISGVSKVTAPGSAAQVGGRPQGSLSPCNLPSRQVPIAQDELALSLGYAASLEASVQDYAGDGSRGPSPPPSDPPDTFPGALDALSSPTSVQEADETTRSDISERPSVDDIESETGSTGALETRSLKDHKGGGVGNPIL